MRKDFRQMTTYSVTLKSDGRPTPKTVTVEEETAIEAMHKAKKNAPSYQEVLSCSIVRINY